MTNAKVHEGFRVDKKVEEHCVRLNFCVQVDCELVLSNIR